MRCNSCQKSLHELGHVQLWVPKGEKEKEAERLKPRRPAGRLKKGMVWDEIAGKVVRDPNVEVPEAPRDGGSDAAPRSRRAARRTAVRRST